VQSGRVRALADPKNGGLGLPTAAARCYMGALSGYVPIQKGTSMNSRLQMMAAALATSALVAAAPAHAKMPKHYRIFPMTSFNSHVAQPPAGDMNYYGGSVFSKVNVVSVMWNKNVLANTQKEIPPFSAALVNSTYIDQGGEYSTKGVKSISGHQGTSQVIKRGTYSGQVVLTPNNTSKMLTDADVQKEIKQQIRAGNLPASDQNTLYMIYFPSDITINLDGALSCQSFGAYHFATIDTRRAKLKNIFYAVEPECNSGFGFLTFAASHEFMEATTDNVPTPGSNPDWPQAWNDAAGYEVGDKCGGSGTLKTSSDSWEVTQFYLNSKHGCSTTATYTSP